MTLAAEDKKPINVRDLEFENKVWKNKLEFLIQEFEIHKNHVESYHVELKGALIEGLLNENLKVLTENMNKAITLEKKVQLQEEEIPLYIKDFPINIHHELYEEHLELGRKINHFFNESRDYIVSLRRSLPGIFAL